MEGYSVVSIVAHEGDVVPQYRLMVRIVFNADNPKEMCESIRYINSKTRILDENNQNMYIPFQIIKRSWTA